MQSEHHIDAFDLPSFFKLHDLDNDGYWTVAEIQAVYGLNPDAAHSHGHAHGQQGGKPGGSQEKDITEKAKVVSDKVLEVMDMNRDGMSKRSQMDRDWLSWRLWREETKQGDSR